MSIAQIDKALGEYYTSVGRTDYFSNGVGFFQRYCEENDFDDSYVSEELIECDDASDSSLTEFDSEFPLLQTMHDSIGRDHEIFAILKNCNDYGCAHKYSDALDIWNVNVHINDHDINEDMRSFIHFIKLKYFGKYDLPLSIINGFIRNVMNSLMSNDITYLIKNYYFINKPNEPLLFRSLIMSILCLLQSDRQCGGVHNFEDSYNRLTSKRYEQLKNQWKWHEPNSDERIPIAATEEQMQDKIQPFELKFQREIADINKYNWIDIINDSIHESIFENEPILNNNFKIFNVEIDLYENDFDLQNVHKLFKRKHYRPEEIEEKRLREKMRNVRIEKNMLSMERHLEHSIRGFLYQLMGPFDNFDALHNEQLKNRLLHFENGKLYNRVIKWYCCQTKRARPNYRDKTFEDERTSIMYFGLLRNSFHVNTAENAVSVSFLVHRRLHEFQKRRGWRAERYWPTI